MQEKGIFTALTVAITYPLEKLLSFVLMILFYPLVVFGALIGDEQDDVNLLS